MSNIIEIKELSFSYNKTPIYENLSLTFEKGKSYGILGKNGVGKSTLINLLMGYLSPKKGECRVFGESAHTLTPHTRKRIALLYEGFITFDYMTIKEVEYFFSRFYEKWDNDQFFYLINLMKLPYERRLSTLSFGQKSQVVLGTLFAQNADLLILDDYSMGLDIGYRFLFIDYLKEYLQKNPDKTVIMTSHVMSELEEIVDEIYIVKKGGKLYHNTVHGFMDSLHVYKIEEKISQTPAFIENIEYINGTSYLYSFMKEPKIKEFFPLAEEITSYGFEKKFLGYVGRY